MTREQIAALAVAYEASRDPKHYQELGQDDRIAFWNAVHALRPAGRMTLPELREHFKADQQGRAA